MRITKVSPVVSAPKTKRAIKEPKKVTYQSEIDPAVIIHSNKTHRTVSEAFRDAEYACSITKFKNDWQLSLEYLSGVVYGFCIVCLALSVPALLIIWLTRSL
jgi:hypothetical protein